MSLKVNRSELFVLSAYVIFCLGWLLTYTMYPIQYRGVQFFVSISGYLSVILLIAKIIQDKKYSVKMLVLMLLFVPFLLFTGYASGQFLKFTFFALLLFSLKDVNLKHLLTAHAILFMMILFITFFGVHLNLIQNIYQTARNGLVTRSYEGFRFTTYGANIVFHFICVWVFLRNKRITLAELVVLAGLNYYYFIKTNTKSSFYIGMLVLFATVLLKIFNVKLDYQNVFTKFWDRYFILVVATIPIYLSKDLILSNSIYQKLNELLTGRLSLGYTAIKRFGIHWFAQPIQWNTYDLYGRTTNAYLYVDASFLNMLLNFGILFLVLILLANVMVGFKNPYRNIYYTVAFSGIVLHSMWDPQFLELWYNPFLLFIGTLIFTPHES